MKTVRNEKIVKLRVIAILLVVIGHSIIIFTPGWNTYQINEKNEILTIIKKFINIIQMPLFIMISGFLYNKIDKNNKVLNIICGILFVTLSFMVVFVVNDINLNRIFVILAGITGTYALYGLCSNNESIKLIKALDKNSFVIYLLHSPLIYIMYSRFSNINPLLLISSNIAIAIIIPIFIAIILRKIKINFIIGEKIK